MNWISVEERFPEKGVRVLTIDYHKDIRILHLDWFFGDQYDDSVWETDRGWADDKDGWWGNGVITHWMPLPDPPKEQS